MVLGIAKRRSERTHHTTLFLVPVTGSVQTLAPGHSARSRSAIASAPALLLASVSVSYLTISPRLPVVAFQALPILTHFVLIKKRVSAAAPQESEHPQPHEGYERVLVAVPARDLQGGLVAGKPCSTRHGAEPYIPQRSQSIKFWVVRS